MFQINTKLKVLQVTPFFPPEKGGIASHVSNLCASLIHEGNKDIQIATPRRIGRIATASSSSPFYLNEENNNNNSYKRYDIPSVYLPGWPYPTLRSVSIPLDFGLRLDSIIKKLEFDIIHVHGHHYPLSWMAINSARKYHIPSILTLHGMYSLNPNVSRGKTKIEDLLNKHLFKRIIGKANAIIGLTEQITYYAQSIVGEEVEREGKLIRFYTIPNGAYCSTYSENLDRKQEYRAKYNIKFDSIVILFIGRLEQVKGVVEFAKAAASLIRQGRKDIEIVIVGEGSLESDVKSTVAGLPGIHILPWQPANQVHELYIASDIFAMTSRFEALPITVIEAMNAGLHILYTPVGGIPDILQRYQRKTMLTEGSAEGIFDMLSKVTCDFVNSQNNQDITYARKFDWKIISQQVSVAYSELKYQDPAIIF